MYQGYENYATWAVNLWLSNDEGDYHFWSERAAEHLEQTEGDADQATVNLGDEIKEAINDSAPLSDRASLYNDLLGNALDSVDWWAVADSFMEEAVSEYQAEHEGD